MKEIAGPEHLSQTRYKTAIVRTVLDEHGRLVRGEVVDAEGDVTYDFAGRSGLAEALRAWLGLTPADEEPENELW